MKMAEGATYAVVPFVNKKALGSVAGIVGAGGNAGAVAAGFLFKGSDRLADRPADPRRDRHRRVVPGLRRPVLARGRDRGRPRVRRGRRQRRRQRAPDRWPAGGLTAADLSPVRSRRRNRRCRAERSDRRAEELPPGVRDGGRRRPRRPRPADPLRQRRRGSATAVAARPGTRPPSVPAGRPEAIQVEAQDRPVADGQEALPRRSRPSGQGPARPCGTRSRRTPATGVFPKGTDVLLFKYPRPVLRRPGAGLVHVPAAASRRRRARRGSSAASPTSPSGCGGGYADVTTRANLQIREIGADDTVDVLDGPARPGHHQPRARAPTTSATSPPARPAGIDPQELIDTLPLAREMHHYILNHREMYGLPRKFNIAFDGGGAIAQPRRHQRHRLHGRPRRRGRRRRCRPGVYFRLHARRDHRPQGLRPRHGRPAHARGVRPRRRGGRPRLHRARRPDRPQEGPAEVRARRAGASTKFLAEVEKQLPASRSAGCRSTECEPPAADRPHGPRRRSTRRSSRACSTSASCCRSAG